MQSWVAALLLLVGSTHVLAMETPAQNTGDGKAIFVRGLVTAEAASVQRALAHKDLIFVEDTLRSGDKASARFVMRDRTMLALQPGTEIRLVEYKFADNSTDSKMVTSVVSGGLRALTGLVDKRNPENVILKTRMATIGVRGTSLRVQILDNGNEEIIFDFGHGFVTNLAGTVAVKAGWGVRVLTPERLPELFEVMPDEKEPAQLAAALLKLSASQARDEASRLAVVIEQEDQILLLGQLEQASDEKKGKNRKKSRESIILAVVEGLMAPSRKLHGPILQTETLLEPKRIKALLRITRKVGGDLEFALAEIASALINASEADLRRIRRIAVDYGVNPERAAVIIESMEQPIPCAVGLESAQ